jgi:hypothetical protein
MSRGLGSFGVGFIGRADDGQDSEEASYGPTPSVWTAEHVGRRLIAAMRVVRGTPMRIGPAQMATAWPIIVQDFSELIDWDRLNEAIERGNWRTVESINAAAREEIAAQKGRDEAEAPLRKKPPTALESSMAEEALGWCAWALADQPLQANSLNLWAWCRSSGTRSGSGLISKVLMDRRIEADRMIAERRRITGEKVSVDQDMAKEAAIDVLAWANARIEATLRTLNVKLQRPAFADKIECAKWTNKQWAKWKKYEERRPRLVRSARQHCASIRAAARHRLEKALKRAGAIKGAGAAIKRSDVMPGLATTRVSFDAARKAGAATIADALNRAKIHVR